MVKKQSINWKGRFRSLGMASPFLVFAAFPVYAIVTEPNRSTTDRVVALVQLGVFLLIYLSAWLLEDFAPVRRWPSPVILVIAAVLVGMQAYPALVHDPGNMFMLCYVVALIMLIPRQYTTHYGLTIFFIGLVEAAVNWSATVAWLAVLIIALNISFIFGIMRNEYRDRERRQQQAHELRRSTEQQRLSLAADLHDVLGQQLTAISMKSAVLVSLLEKVQADDFGEKAQAIAQLASKEATEIQDLSRQALTDVRRVVARSRNATFDEELAAAKMLLDAADISLTVSWDCPREDIPEASVVGRFGPYVIREACTNVARHGQGVTLVQIRVGLEKVSVTDNGVEAPERAKSAAGSQNWPSVSEAEASQGGTGLLGLAARMDGFATLEWGSRTDGHKGWQVTLQALETN